MKRREFTYLKRGYTMSSSGGYYSRSSARRIFWIEMLLILAVLASGLYWLGPRFFGSSQVYAPESVVQEVFQTFLDARERCQDALRNSSGEGLPPEQIITKALAPLKSNQGSSPAILIGTSSGLILPGRQNPPAGLPINQLPLAQQNHGALILRAGSEACFVLFERIPGSEYCLIVAKPFIPLFSLGFHSLPSTDFNVPK
ncbi:MAG: hypothetical protein ACE15F_09825 [bacterium]